MRLVATIEDPRIVEQISTHLGLPSEPVRADPAQPPPASAADLFAETPDRLIASPSALTRRAPRRYIFGRVTGLGGGPAALFSTYSHVF